MSSDEAFVRRDCPCCATPPRSPVEVHSAQYAEAMNFEGLVPAWNGFFKERVFFSYVRCEGCGLLYAPIFFTRPQLETLYAQMPPNMDGVPADALRRTQRGYFDTLKKHSDFRGGFIEIGPDVGYFTENCVREGQHDFYWLFEPNRDVEGALSTAMGDKAFRIVHDMFGFSEVGDGAASTAVMVHVLDHLLDPIAMLSELRQKLKPGARLLVVTHDESSLLRKVMGPRWPAFCLQHPQIYNPNSMRKIMDAAGFNVIELSKTVNHFPVSFLLKHLLWALRLKVQKVPSFFGLALGLRLGNMITIAEPATKPLPSS